MDTLSEVSIGPASTQDDADVEDAQVLRAEHTLPSSTPRLHLFLGTNVYSLGGAGYTIDSRRPVPTRTSTGRVAIVIVDIARLRVASQGMFSARLAPLAF